MQLNTPKSSSVFKDKVKEKQLSSIEKQQQDAFNREAAAAKRMQELVRRFEEILQHITQHKWAHPFMHPVDVEGLALRDYYKEKGLEEEEAKTQIDMKLAQEVVHTNMAWDLTNELFEVDMQLENLRQRVFQKYRKMSTEEKKKLGTALTRLSPEDLSKALEIVAENNPGFQPTAQEVDLDIDAQSEITLWRLKGFVHNTLRLAGKCSEGADHPTKSNSKRKGEISNAVSKML